MLESRGLFQKDIVSLVLFAVPCGNALFECDTGRVGFACVVDLSTGRKSCFN